LTLIHDARTHEHKKCFFFIFVCKHNVTYLVKNTLSDVSGSDIRLRINTPQLWMIGCTVFVFQFPR